jgi:hypothetical protein
MSLFRTKTIASLQAEAAAEHGYKRTLGPISLISLGIGSVVGAGIFVQAGTRPPHSTPARPSPSPSFSPASPASSPASATPSWLR